MIMNKLFYFFSALLLISAMGILLVKEPIHALICLLASFICTSILLLMLECEFIALLLIIVYVGAIGVLFLFTIMMMDLKTKETSQNFGKYFPISMLFMATILLPLLYIINTNEFFSYSSSLLTSNLYLNPYRNWYDLIDATNDVNVFGQILYSYFVVQFLITGFILLLTIIGVVYLTNSSDKQSLRQSQFKQLSRKSKIF